MANETGHGGQGPALTAPPRRISWAGLTSRDKVLTYLFAKCQRVPETGCVVWGGAKLQSGYGVMHARLAVRSGVDLPLNRFGKIFTHRATWTLVNGRIPDGLHVCHHCDNPPCCNPAHLFLGTDADNSADKHRKGREFRKYPKGTPRAVMRANVPRKCANCARDFLVRQDQIDACAAVCCSRSCAAYLRNSRRVA